MKEQDLVQSGRGFCDSGDLQKALTCLNEVIEMNSESSEAFYVIGNVFHKNGEMGKAIKAFTKVLELEPAHTDAAISLSILYNDIGKYDKAQEIFEKAHEQVKSIREPTEEFAGDPHINKKFSFKHYELADIYLSYRRYDEALFEYKKAVALDPGNLEARIKAAKAYAKKGLISKAADELRRLKTEHPQYHPARIALGVLYFSHSKVIEAQTEWQKVLSLDPENQEAKMYLTMSKSATETSLSNA